MPRNWWDVDFGEIGRGLNPFDPAGSARAQRVAAGRGGLSNVAANVGGYLNPIGGVTRLGQDIYDYVSPDPLKRLAGAGGALLGSSVGGVPGGIAGYGLGEDLYGRYRQSTGVSEQLAATQRAEEAELIRKTEEEGTRQREQQMSILGQQTANLYAMQDPHDPRSPAFQRGLQTQRAAALLNFAPQRARLSEQLASRGLLGSGLEAAAQAGLAGQQAGSLASIEAAAYRDAAGKQAEFELERQRLFGQLADRLGLTAADRQKQANFYMDLAFKAAEAGRADEARKYQLLAQIFSSGIQAGGNVAATALPLLMV